MFIAMDGFDNYTGADEPTLLNGNFAGISSAFINHTPSTDTRWGYGRSMAPWGSNKYRLAINNRTKVFQGVAIKKIVGPNAVSDPVFEVYDGTTLQCWCAYDSINRQINVYRGSGTTNLIAQSSTNVTPVWDNWFYIEWCPLIHPSAGTIEVRLNGTNVVINASGLNTRASANSQITVAAMAVHSANERTLCDDYYCFDDQGTVNNNFNGDSRVYSNFADTDNAVQFTRSTGAVNADNVDDLADINDDTDYNSSSTVGQIDSFNIEQVPANAIVSAIQPWLVARKDNAANRTTRISLERASNVANGSALTLNGSYAMWVERYDNDPTDSSPLTAAKINAMHLRYEVLS